MVRVGWADGPGRSGPRSWLAGAWSGSGRRRRSRRQTPAPRKCVCVTSGGVREPGSSGCLEQTFGSPPHALQRFYRVNQSGARRSMACCASNSVPRLADLLLGPGPLAVCGFRKLWPPGFQKLWPLGRGMTRVVRHVSSTALACCQGRRASSVLLSGKILDQGLGCCTTIGSGAWFAGCRYRPQPRYARPR
jgi:hypothetical protein